MLIFNDERSNATSQAFDHRGGPLQVQAIGLQNGVPNNSLNGATVQLQARQDNLEWRDLDNGRFTEPDLVILDAKSNTQIRAVITGQTGTNGVTLSFM